MHTDGIFYTYKIRLSCGLCGFSHKIRFDRKQDLAEKYFMGTRVSLYRHVNLARNIILRLCIINQIHVCMDRHRTCCAERCVCEARPWLYLAVTATDI